MTAPLPSPISVGQAGTLPMQRALARALALLAMLVLAVSLVVVFVTGTILLRRYAHENLSHVAWQAAYAAEVPVVFNDRTAASEAVRYATGLEGVTAITVRDAGGRVVARVLRNGLSEADIGQSWLDPKPVRHAIVNGGTTIGSVEVAGETTGIAALLLACLISILAASGLAWAMIRLVSRRLHRSMIAPLQEIAATAHAFSRDRAMQARAPRARIAEVDALSQDFNRLLDEMEGWQKQVKVAHEQLLDRANHDTLSGLPNRAHFMDRLRHQLDHAQRNGQPFALLYLDGDHFKATNDRYGHAAGDQVIRDIGARLMSIAGPDVVAARVGGDEFALLLPHQPGEDAAQATAERIAGLMARPVVLADGTAIDVSLTIGTAHYPEDGSSVDALIAHADAAMYAAKADSRAGTTARRREI